MAARNRDRLAGVLFLGVRSLIQYWTDVQWIQTMKHPQRDSMLESVKQYLQQLYGEQLKAVILYGSQAREDAHEFSDIDLLVVLDAPINPSRD
ncbi:MAG: nucleotidyltransferase domain-containing protein [Cyanobacteria bacterium P01_H01_bin.152]